MKNSIPILNRMLEITIDSDLKDTNYKQLYIQCKKNVKQFISIVQKQFQTILQNHSIEKQSLINQIKHLKYAQNQKSTQKVSQSNYCQSKSKTRSHSSDSFRNPESQENLQKINQVIKQNMNGTSSTVSFQIDNLLQKTMNRSAHMKQLQKLFVGQSKISKIQSVKSSARQILRQKKNNIQIEQLVDIKHKNMNQQSQRKLRDKNLNLSTKQNNKSSNTTNIGSVNNILSGMRQTMNQKIQNQSNLAYKSICKSHSSLIQSPYFGKAN